MSSLISPREAAKRIGVGVGTVKTWALRANDPLPSVRVGATNTHMRILASEIDSWLARQATSK